MKYRIQEEIDLQCQICGRDEFVERRGQLNTRLMTLFNLDWLNPSARCLICQFCGYVHWFASRGARQP